jgi:rsbT co-antagonist protein RsbR
MERETEMADYSDIAGDDAAITSSLLLHLYKVTPEDQTRIREFGEKAIDHMEQAVTSFYEWLVAEPWFEEFFTDEEVLDRVKQAQLGYWTAFMSANVDEAYIQRRQVVGKVHARIGLPLNAYFAGMNVMQSIFADLLEQTVAADQHAAILESMSKLMHLDTAIVVDTYNDAFQEALRDQAESIMAMSTPVTEIWDGILFLPIVGLIDSHRARDVMNSTLAKIAAAQAQVFILDISGVGVVDTAVANNLIRITRATKLMGCESIISGVSPAIAQTIVDLGIDVGQVRTTATMRDALSLSFRRVGAAITVGG